MRRACGAPLFGGEPGESGTVQGALYRTRAGDPTPPRAPRFGHWGPLGARSSARPKGAPFGHGEPLGGRAGGRAGGCSAELGLSADSSDSTRNQRGIGRIGLSVREPFCFRDWTVCQWIRIESKVRQIATRGKLPGFRAVTGVSLGNGLFSSETSENQRFAGNCGPLRPIAGDGTGGERSSGASRCSGAVKRAGRVAGAMCAALCRGAPP